MADCQAREEAPQQQPQGEQQPEQQQQQHSLCQQHNAQTEQEAPQEEHGANQPPEADPEPVQRLGSSCTLLPSSHQGQRVWECSDFCGRPCIIKQKQQQSAKHPFLDNRKAAKSPCQTDVAGMYRARKLGVPTPTPYHLDKQHSLVFTSKQQGAVTLGQRLAGAETVDEGLQKVLAVLGQLLAQLHDGGFVHGSLSCSCVQVVVEDSAQQSGGSAQPQLVLCDFEHSYSTRVPREKAADLVLLEADLQATHPQLSAQCFEKLCAAYNKHSKQWSATHNRLPEARQALQKHAQGQGSKKQRTK